MAEKLRILVVEDDMDIQELVRYNLQKTGYQVESAFDGESGLQKTVIFRPDLILLDIMMPKLNGIEVCRRLKTDSVTARIPVVFMTAKTEEGNIITGLDAGAQDYICKPFSIRVLLARVRACLRKVNPSISDEARPVLTYRTLEINPGLHTAKLRGVPVDLTATEFRLLYFLAEYPGRVYTREQIIDAVRGDDYAVTDRAVDVQVAGLRKKLGEFGEFIETVRGVGYRLREAGL